MNIAKCKRFFSPVPFWQANVSRSYNIFLASTASLHRGQAYERRHLPRVSHHSLDHIASLDSGAGVYSIWVHVM